LEEVVRSNLLEGINYYKSIIPHLNKETDGYVAGMKEELVKAASVLSELQMPLLKGEELQPGS
jgi:hypothetical protein